MKQLYCSKFIKQRKLFREFSVSNKNVKMDDFGSQNVELYIYDMSQGMASMMSPLLLGKYLKVQQKFQMLMVFLVCVTGRQIDGIWHTAVVVFGREYFFGTQGITSCSPVSI